LDWVQALAKTCQNEDILLIIDEVQTGMGRTGTLFAYEQYGIEPDMITLAKGLGSGFPVGALLAKEKSAISFQPGTHGSTFGGNPLAMTAALATLETIAEINIIDQVQKNSTLIFNKLTDLKKQFPSIVDVRGKGFLIGIQFNHEIKWLMDALREQHILVLVAGADVLRILPPLNTTIEEINQFLTIIHRILIDQRKEGSS
jgi:acetylornithine/N-succinyldiaminopimelate aminotransferase